MFDIGPHLVDDKINFAIKNNDENGMSSRKVVWPRTIMWRRWWWSSSSWQLSEWVEFLLCRRRWLLFLSSFLLSHHDLNQTKFSSSLKRKWRGKKSCLLFSLKIQDYSHTYRVATECVIPWRVFKEATSLHVKEKKNATRVNIKFRVKFST